VARSGIQAPLQLLLDFQERPYSRALRVGIAIIVANLVFAAAHAHLSLSFALAAFFPGLVWGLIFWRTNSLIAASVSHVVIGLGALFFLGIEDILAPL
jgi:membrane protease YdiL (CAAX protease family)